MIFTAAYKDIVDSMSRDWQLREQHGIYTFEAISLEIADPLNSTGIEKEINLPETKRMTLYKLAFEKIISPAYPELKMLRLNSDKNVYIIKS